MYTVLFILILIFKHYESFIAFCNKIIIFAMSFAYSFSPDPTVRHSILTLLVGGFFWWLQVNAVNQNMIQRYLTLPAISSARA